ncbi:heparinase II/III domain-containing protein [Cellulosimicrobium sp. AB352]|uniref:heparinase II/III domain-containing protein n=1 Tax=Cellulosimicrobium sp. AB352 TaxID=3413281 RepID=UPI003C136E6D
MTTSQWAQVAPEPADLGTTRPVPRLDAWLLRTAASGMDAAYDEELDGPASACSLAQLLGYVVSTPSLPADVKSVLQPRLASALGDAVGTDGHFALPYNRAPQEVEWWDLAEVGAAAPALLLAARSGIEVARGALLRGADFVRAKERGDVPGSFMKNADALEQDILNADAYAALALACAAEVSPTSDRREPIEAAVERLIQQFGIASAGWWPYSVGLGSTSDAVGTSLAYQATIVGCGLLLLPHVDDTRRDRLAGVLLAASEQVATAFSADFDERLETPSWSRDWVRIPEIAWALPRRHPESGIDAALDHLEGIDPVGDPGETSKRPDRTPVTTTYRRFANLAGSAVLLGLTAHAAATVRGTQGLALRPLGVDFLERHGDPTLRAAPGRWVIDSSRGEVTLPNRVTVELPANAEGWRRTDREQAQSSLLWLHSLGFLPSMIERDGAAEEAVALLSSYWAFMTSAVSKDVRDFMTSYDHCVAVRLRTSCMVAVMLERAGRGVPPELLRLVRTDLEWARQPGHVKNNNHGMMLCAAVLHAGVVFPGFVDEEQSGLAEDDLARIILGAFDDQGVCLENTPSYHAFYLRFMRDLLPFAAEYYPAGSLHSLLAPLMTKASEVIELLVWQDGTLPPIGDSGAEKSSVRSRDGVLFAPDAGIFVKKEDEVYLSIRGGYSSIVHKHCDDTALTLRVAGSELLLDGGMYNYDWKDERTAVVKSQRGHSGVFFERFDRFYPATLYRPGAERVRSTMERLEGGAEEDRIKCSVEIDGSHVVERVVAVKEGQLSVVDTFRAPNGERALQRFLVPLGASLEISAGRIRVETADGRAWMEIGYDPARAAREFCGARDPLRGWVSRAWNQIEQCRTLEILPREGETVMAVEIRFGTME